MCPLQHVLVSSLRCDMFFFLLFRRDEHHRWTELLFVSQLMWSCNLNQIICSNSQFFMKHLHYHCVSHRAVTLWFCTTWEVESLHHFSQAVISSEEYYMWWMLMWSVKEKKTICKSAHKTALITQTSCDLPQICGTCGLLEVVSYTGCTILTHVTPENRALAADLLLV